MEKSRAAQREVRPGNSFGRTSAPSCQRKLDLDAPLLSVRKHATFSDEESASRSVAKGSSAVDLGSLRSPGTVPFIWEHSPGQPKAKQITLSVLPAIPAPPQGRSSPSLNERRSGNSNLSHDQSIFHHVLHDQRDRLPADEVPGGPFSPMSLFPNKTFEAQTQMHSLAMAELQEKHPSVEDDPAACDNITEEGEAFSDAVDTFDQTEEHTRTSVISTIDEQNRSAFTLQCADHSSRDFIMRRFLPAAKAMAVELPTATTSPSERSNQRRIPYSPLGQLQRSSVPRPPVTDRLANLTDKRVTEYTSENEDLEPSAFSPKACGFFSYRLGAAFKNLLPQSSPARSKSKSKLHLVQFGRRSHDKSNEAFQESGKSSNQDESSESNSSEDERESVPKVRYGLQPDSERGTLIGTGLLNRIRQSPQHLLHSNRVLADPVQSQRTEYVSTTSYEAKGFLGMPKDVALSMSKKQEQGLGHLGTTSIPLLQAQRPSPSETNARYGGPFSKRNAFLGSPSMSEMQFHFGTKLENDSGLSSLRQSNLVDGGDHSEFSSTTSDTSSLYGHGSHGATAETGETSTTEAKTDVCRECGSHLHSHPKNPFNGGKGVSLASAEGPGRYLISENQLSSNPTFANRSDCLEYRKLSTFANPSDRPDYQTLAVQAKVKKDSPEQPYTYTPPRLLPPPLPKSPSHSWLWRKSAASASFLGQSSPEVKSPHLDLSRMKGVKWESMVKSHNLPCHLRYSETSSPLVHD